MGEGIVQGAAILHEPAGKLLDRRKVVRSRLRAAPAAKAVPDCLGDGPRVATGFAVAAQAGRMVVGMRVGAGVGIGIPAAVWLLSVARWARGRP
jgi:hypothetical protein